MKKELEPVWVCDFSKYLILRFSKIFSTDVNDKTIYSEIIESIKKQKYIKLFSNQYVHYLDVRDFIRGFKKIITKLNQINGTFNFPGKEFTTRYAFTKKICYKKKLNTKYFTIYFKKNLSSVKKK